MKKIDSFFSLVSKASAFIYMTNTNNRGPACNNDLF